MAPGANLAAVKVFDSTGSGTFGAVAAGIDWCRTNAATFGISVINMSLGDSGSYTSTTCPVIGTVNTAILNAYNANITPVASSGNDGYTNGISFPACMAQVVSVGATYDDNVGSQTWCTQVINNVCTATCTDSTTQADKVVCLTNRSADLDLLAPGAVITSSASTQGTSCGAPSGGLDDCSGTSMAAPHVAGAAALIKHRNPLLTPAQVKAILKNSGELIADSSTGLTFPRLDAVSYFACTDI
jgi:subtilisin family serine protease